MPALADDNLLRTDDVLVLHLHEIGAWRVACGAYTAGVVLDELHETAVGSVYPCLLYLGEVDGAIADTCAAEAGVGIDSLDSRYVAAEVGLVGNALVVVVIELTGRIRSFNLNTEVDGEARNGGVGGRQGEKYSYYGRLAKNKVKLYPNVMAQIRRKMPHYANQLVNQCIENGSVRKINGEYVWENKR